MVKTCFIMVAASLNHWKQKLKRNYIINDATSREHVNFNNIVQDRDAFLSKFVHLFVYISRSIWPAQTAARLIARNN